MPVSESLFQLLLETTVRSTGPNDPTGQAITALSCACLFSLVVSWGDTGKILQAVSAILTNNGSHACQTIQVRSTDDSLLPLGKNLNKQKKNPFSEENKTSFLLNLN